MRRTASIIGIVFGAIFVVAGIVTWIVITTTLSSQKITVSNDASCRAGAKVAGPLSAYCQATVIDKHTMEITGGKTYAELAKDDPNRDTAMTSSFLQASLFTSVVAFGVAAMAVAVGIAFLFFGLALREPKAAAPTASAG
jgi:ABC-type sugar transport system permease subunit